MMDVTLIETGNGGDLVLSGNDLSIVDGISNMPYIAMFGGSNFWGNDLLFDNDDLRFSAETENILLTVPLNSQGRSTIEAAIKRDLQFLLNDVPNTELIVTCRIVSDNRLEIFVKFGGTEFNLLWNPQNQSLVNTAITAPSARIWGSPIRSGDSASYGLTDIRMRFGSSTATIPAWVFYSTANEVSRVAAMNALAPSLGLGGTFAIIGNNIVYNQGYAENWAVDGDLFVLPEMAALRLDVPSPSGAPQDWSYVYAGLNSYQVTDFGDGGDPSMFMATDIFTHPASHTYASGVAPKTVNIFHDNTRIGIFNFHNTSTAYTVGSITGVLPTSLHQLSLQGQKLDAVCDMSIINTLVNVVTLVIAGSGSVTDFSPNLFTAPLPMLRLILVSGNKITSTAVDKVFNSYVATNPGFSSIINGNIYTVGQSPSAPPTGTSAASRAALISAGWTIVTD